MEEGANSTLSIARVGPADSGNYTCALTTMPDQPAIVHVHVLNGEALFSTIFINNYFSIRYTKVKGPVYELLDDSTNWILND